MTRGRSIFGKRVDLVGRLLPPRDPISAAHERDDDSGHERPSGDEEPDHGPHGDSSHHVPTDTASISSSFNIGSNW